ncbi:MAG: flagellar hook-basal body complex protein FliE [Halorhodospira sp.]
MSDQRIEQALAEMRAIGGQQAGQAESSEQDAPPVEEFSSLLRDAVENVNEHQVHSSDMKEQYMQGEEVPLTDVMIAAQKSSVSFDALKEVRNKFLEAYQEIAKMQV